jgi:hypothetical protein
MKVKVTAVVLSSDGRAPFSLVDLLPFCRQLLSVDRTWCAESTIVYCKAHDVVFEVVVVNRGFDSFVNYISGPKVCTT